MNEVRHEEELLEREIPIYEINLSEGVDGYDMTEQKKLAKELRKLRLYGINFGYTAFPPELLERVLNSGTFHEENDSQIDCCVLNPPGGPRGVIGHTDNDDILMYALPPNMIRKRRFGYVAVYDKTQLKLTHIGFPHFEFSNPEKKKEALLAVIKLTF